MFCYVEPIKDYFWTTEAWWQISTMCSKYSKKVWWTVIGFTQTQKELKWKFKKIIIVIIIFKNHPISAFIEALTYYVLRTAVCCHYWCFFRPEWSISDSCQKMRTVGILQPSFQKHILSLIIKNINGAIYTKDCATTFPKTSKINKR